MPLNATRRSGTAPICSSTSGVLLPDRRPCSCDSAACLFCVSLRVAFSIALAVSFAVSAVCRLTRALL